MSELKEHLFVPYSELQEGDELTDAITIAKSYYIKSEADKVIADLIEKNKRLARKDIIMARNAIKDVYKELRHSKYKRCMAMAKVCKARYDEEDAKENWCGLSWEYISKEMKYWERWRNRWLKIAEKFKDKEAK